MELSSCVGCETSVRCILLFVSEMADQGDITLYVKVLHIFWSVYFEFFGDGLFTDHFVCRPTGLDHQ